MALKVVLSGILFEEEVATPPTPPPPPIDYIVKRISIDSIMMSQSVKSTIRFEIQMFKTIDLKLLGGSHAIAEHQCNEITDDGDIIKATHGRITMREDNLSLIDTQRNTLYEIVLVAMMPYSNYLKQSINYGPLPISNHISYKACIKYDYLPAQCTVSDSLSVIHSNCEGEDHLTNINAVLLPVETFSVKWTFPKKIVEKPTSSDVKKPATVPTVPVQIKALVVTSGQDYLHTVGGGICCTTLYQHYTVLNGSVSNFVLELDEKHGSRLRDSDSRMENSPRMRIMSVTGKYLASWDHSKRNNLLTMKMEQAVQGVLHFTISMELEMAGSSCLLCPSKLKPLSVSRNKGNIAIQACSGIEIRDTEVLRATKVDRDELPETFDSLENILFSFKFLSSANYLILEIVRYDDLMVLVATAERAKYTITHTGEFLFYNLAYEILNSECQFLRLDIPPKAKIWSAVVAGDPVKPSMDEESILLPLIKFSDKTFIVELMYAIRDVLPSSATEQQLVLNMPAVDIPINKLFLKLYTPIVNVYSQWNGNIEECCSSNEFDIRHVSKREIKESKSQRRTEQEWMYCLNPEPVDEESDDDEDGDGNTGGVALGLKPLKLQTSVFHTGREFYLQKLVVPAKALIKVSCSTCKGYIDSPRTLEKEKLLYRQDSGCCMLM